VVDSRGTATDASLRVQRSVTVECAPVSESGWLVIGATSDGNDLYTSFPDEYDLSYFEHYGRGAMLIGLSMYCQRAATKVGRSGSLRFGVVKIIQTVSPKKFFHTFCSETQPQYSVT
jgi:hypothetical protein